MPWMNRYCVSSSEGRLVPPGQSSGAAWRARVQPGSQVVSAGRVSRDRAGVCCQVSGRWQVRSHPCEKPRQAGLGPAVASLRQGLTDLVADMRPWAMGDTRGSQAWMVRAGGAPSALIVSLQTILQSSHLSKSALLL